LVIDVSNTVYWQTPLWAWKSKKLAYLNQLALDVFYYEYPRLISRLGIFFERVQYLTYKFVPFACYANSTKSDLVKIGVPKRNIQTFSLGVDHLRYFPGRKSSTPLFICVNRLVKMKRTDLAITAMKYVIKTHPKARLIVVGTGYDRPRLELLRNNLHLQAWVSFADENIWFFGKNAKDDKVKLMQNAWALIFPSVKEGWGMTVTECAACGTPAIVSSVTGLVDSVVHNKTGIVLNSNPSAEQIAAAMIDLISRPKLRNKLSQGAIKFASEFTWEKSCQDFERIINNK